jgi:hypothetical protein
MTSFKLPSLLQLYFKYIVLKLPHPHKAAIAEEGCWFSLTVTATNQQSFFFVPPNLLIEEPG